jgi:signal transduction histidine kinase
MTPIEYRRVAGALLVTVLAAAVLQDWLSGRVQLLPAVVGCLPVVGAWVLNVFWPRRVWAVLMGIGPVALAWLGAQTSTDVALSVTIITLARVLPEVVGAAVALIVLGITDAVLAARWGTMPPANLLFSTLGAVALYALVVTLGRLRRQQEQTKAALEELRLSREAQVEAAKTAERVHLAREMHDVLGHTLSALAVQLEGARLLMEREGSSASAVEAVARAHRLAGEGLDEARRAVGALRGGELPGPDLLPGLVEGFEHDSGTEARMAVEGEPSELAPEARLALYRTTQEALTNVRRHSQATWVNVRLRWEPGGAELTVENDGVEGDGTARAGYGLTGMKERAELLGGRLELSTEGGRFRVRLFVPASVS